MNPLEDMPLNFQMNFLNMEIRKPEKGISEFVEIEPKVMESYDPIPGRVHRKVDIERKKRKVRFLPPKPNLKKSGGAVRSSQHERAKVLIHSLRRRTS